MKNYQIPFHELNLHPEEILLEMGYKDVIPEAYVTDTLRELWDQVQQEITAECTFLIETGQLTQTKLIINNIELNSGTTITSLLQNSTQFAVFAATAGAQFEELMNRIKEESDMLKTYIMDVIGTYIVEKAGECMEKYLEGEIDYLQHTNRFSPGYCSWHLSEQKKIFQLLGGKPCGITLSDVCLMNPIKSISGVIGIGENVSQKQYACQYCELETCYKRKI